jgi:ABC-2 type transport system permease protein
MTAAWALLRREFLAYFRTPAGWIIIAFYLLLTGGVFALWVLQPQRPASMRTFFEVSGWLLMPVAPAISMRLLAEELRTGTIEALMTAPISTPALVAGKLLGAWAFVLAMLLPTLAYPIVLVLVSAPTPDVGPIVAGYACLALLGLLYVSIGLFASACTPNATLAFLATLFAILALLLSGLLGRQVGEPWRGVLHALWLPARTGDFAKGVIDSSHVVFFVALSALAGAGAMIVIEARRWR